MYKHGAKPEPEQKPEKDTLLESQMAKGGAVEQSTESSLKKVDDISYLKDLLEKNVKWSQIIYEQNRKINNKLLWAAVASWLRMAIIAVPIIWAAFYLPPLLKDFQERYFKLFGANFDASKSQSIQDLLNLLPLNNNQREQVKAMIK